MACSLEEKCIKKHDMVLRTGEIERERKKKKKKHCKFADFGAVTGTPPISKNTYSAGSILCMVCEELLTISLHSLKWWSCLLKVYVKTDTRKLWRLCSTASNS